MSHNNNRKLKLLIAAFLFTSTYTYILIIIIPTLYPLLSGIQGKKYNNMQNTIYRAVKIIYYIIALAFLLIN